MNVRESFHYGGTTHGAGIEVKLLKLFENYCVHYLYDH